MIARLWSGLRDRFLASDPGFVRLRLGVSAVAGIAIAVLALLPFGLPLTTTIVGAIGAMLAAFAVSDPEPRDQAVTMLLGALTGAVALTAASLGTEVPPLDSIVFVLLIFVAVYAQRFGPRGTALGSIAFFLFFFAMFLQTRLAQVPTLLLALVIGVLSSALVRFLLLPRRPEQELLRVRVAFRARLAAVVRTAAGHLASRSEDPSTTALDRAVTRLHECVLLIEDTAEDVVGPASAGRLRRRAIEVELAVQGLTGSVRQAAEEALPADTRSALVADLHRLRSLIERDPRDLPLISATEEFSRMLVEGSRLADRAAPGDQVRRAIAELAVADVNAQRIAEHDLSAETEPEPEAEPEEPTRAFAYDNQTRSAIQAVVGGGLAVVGGELVSPQRWYWAVLTVFVVFVGASTAGATFVKGARRLGGTLVGLFGGVVSALLVAGNVPATLVLILLCVFGMVYMSRVSQAVMAFFITTMLGLLYSLLGTFSIEVLWIRLAETAVGAVAGMLAAFVIVPVRTRSVMLDDVAATLEELREFVVQATVLLSGKDNVSIIALSRDIDRSIAQVRTTVEPLTHPINVSSSRRDYGWYVLSGLETIGLRARHVAARAQPGLLADDHGLREVSGRLIAAVDVLLTAVRAPGEAVAGSLAAPSGLPPAAAAADAQQRSVLAGLEQLDGAVVALGRAFGATA
ncbi:hypothetical protein CFN78_11420 [Amycolatopsis antarctica]|uniref:Integral membrane bound transporter domain-containing protein n=1 Tax=Amycolatopsis antarctica TaxID=1854586 RepID=A0A263D324_9PSEU|nr:FUSC family protein [Amycolatopsis antarctica]OZM72872.1 hypothetical protein CFN78_11420 [Amycolatopsis antarctica]